jgi:hypothetical protein
MYNSFRQIFMFMEKYAGVMYCVPLGEKSHQVIYKSDVCLFEEVLFTELIFI